MQPGLNPKEPFVWGAGGKAKTPEQIARERQMAEAILARAGDTSPVEHWSQGAARVVDALGGVIRERRADRAESANMEREQGLLSQLFGGTAMSGGSGAGASMAPGGGAPASASGSAAPRPSAPASGAFSEIGPRLMTDLMRDFELSPDQAAGIVGNLAHETGGFRHMQEIQPVVPGSRGGFGFAQWTGPRRRQFEGWAQEQGLDLNSYDANYGFLAHELRNTPEGRVLGDLRGAPDAQTAARVFSDRFLRPGIPHMDSRIAMASQALGFAPSMADMPAPGAAEAGGQQDIAAALAALHPENQQQASYASMPGADNAVYRGQFDGVSPEQMQRQPVNRGELDGVDPQSLLLRRQPGAQPVHPLDAAARLSQDTQQMGMPADQTQELAAALLGRQASAQEAGISPRVPGAGQDFQGVQPTGDVSMMGGAPGSFGMAGPGVQAGQMGVTPRTPFEGASSAVEMGMQPAPVPQAAPTPAPPPVASVADMPARQAMAAQGQQQPAFMQAVNDPSIDPDAFGAGESMPRSVGNVLAARAFMARGEQVPERLQSLIEGDMQRASAFGGGQPAQAQPSMAPADPRQAVAQAMMSGGGQQGGMAAGGASMPAQADPRQQVAQAMASRADQAMQIMMDPRMSPQARQMAQMIFQQDQAQQQAAQERAMQQQQLQQAGIDPNYAGIDPLISAAAQDRYNRGPTSVQEFQFGQENPGFVDFRREMAEAQRPQTNVDARNMGSIPPGMQIVTDPETGAVRMEEIPGGPAERERLAEERSREQQQQLTARQLNPTIDDITTARDLAEARTMGFIPRTGMFSNVLRMLPGAGQSAVDLERTVEGIKAGTSLENLNQMRQASPTGGALGNVSDKQSALLSDAFGSLDVTLSRPVFLYNLARVENTLNDIVHGPDGGPQRHNLQGMRERLRGEMGVDPSGLPGGVDVWGDEAGTQPARQGEAPPAPGTVIDGYRFRGGDPGDPNSWEVVR